MLYLGCDSNPAEPRLDPQLLHDDTEVAAYLEAFPTEEYEVFEVPGIGRFYLDDNPAKVKQALRIGQPWEPHLLREFEKHVVPGTSVLDVGAHIGSLAIPFARLVGDEGRVYAFEPQKKVFRELVYNLRLNGITNVIPLRFAISSEPGIIEMNPIVENDGQVEIGTGGDQAEARTIDSFGFSNVSVIKIDVEGHEAHILRGAERTINTLHPVILVEIWEDTLDVVVPILRGFGYSVRPIRGSDYVAIFRG